MIRTFNLRGINAEEYARLCRLIDVPPPVTQCPDSRDSRFFHLKDWVYFGNVAELARDFPGGSQVLRCIWMPGEREQGEARYMTQRNPGEYFVEIDAQRDHHRLVVATGKKSNKTEKRRDIFDFERASSGWALVSLAIRGCNLDCYELIADGRLMQRGEVLRYNIIRAVFGD